MNANASVPQTQRGPSCDSKNNIALENTQRAHSRIYRKHHTIAQRHYLSSIPDQTLSKQYEPAAVSCSCAQPVRNTQVQFIKKFSSSKELHQSLKRKRQNWHKTLAQAFMSTVSSPGLFRLRVPHSHLLPERARVSHAAQLQVECIAVHHDGTVKYGLYTDSFADHSSVRIWVEYAVFPN